MVDPDAPSRAAASYRHWLHWLVVDLTGHCNSTMCVFDADCKTKAQTRETVDPAAAAGDEGADADAAAARKCGKTLAAYAGPSPPPGSGLHRYLPTDSASRARYTATILTLYLTDHHCTQREYSSLVRYDKSSAKLDAAAAAASSGAAAAAGQVCRAAVSAAGALLGRAGRAGPGQRPRQVRPQRPGPGPAGRRPLLRVPALIRPGATRPVASHP
jgi:hypothetical protein